MFTNRRSVLHVDDDPLITELIAEHLNAAGFDSEAVHDPREAMTRLHRGQHRIVLVDVHMPQVSGLQLLEEIKKVDAGVRVILLTALVNETTVLEANRLGAEACLFKPLCDAKPLIEVVEDSYRRNQCWWETLGDLTRRRKQAEEEMIAQTGPSTAATSS